MSSISKLFSALVVGVLLWNVPVSFLSAHAGPHAGEIGVVKAAEMETSIAGVTSHDETATEEVSHAEEENHLAYLLLVIAVILVAAKVFHLIEKIKQPLVIGELVAGIVLGNLVLVGVDIFHNFSQEPVIEFLAEFGVILLLFQIGLESNIAELRKAGLQSLIVACIGAFAPFILGTWVVGPLLLPGQQFITYLFLGASLAATSVGITARVFKDLGYLKTKAATIVIGAAVIDDVLGLIILAVVSAMALGGDVSLISVGLILVKSVGFLLGSIIIGQFSAPWISKAFAKISTGTGTKFTVAIAFSLLFSAVAKLIGLEPIIGAFAAGLVLDHVHFKAFRAPHVVEQVNEVLAEIPAKSGEKVSKIMNKFADKSVEDTIEQLALFFVPIFFVVTGMGVSLSALFSFKILLLALGISLAAFAGKFISGLFLKGDEKFIVGLAMIPRGEVGLIFAAVGRSLNVIDDEIFSLIVAVVLITTIVGPFLLSQQLKKVKTLA